jgi:TatD DNase family protein
VIDSHCHLADEAFRDDLEAVVARARQAGLERALVVVAAGDAGEAEQARRVQTLWPDVRLAVGVHPHSARDFADDPKRAAAVVRDTIASLDGVCAVGEIGLDYHYDFSPPDVQRAVFRAQLEVARELEKPIVIHTREADADTLALLAEDGRDLRGVLHCFTGTAEVAHAALGLGFHLSLAGIVTFPKAAELRAVAAGIPPDRLLVETDSPFLAPVPLRGTRNEPAHVVLVLDRLASLYGIAPPELAARTTANFHALFGP